MLMAGLDGIKRKIDPTAAGFGPYDRNLYELSEAEKLDIRRVPATMEEALDALMADHEFCSKAAYSPARSSTTISASRGKKLNPLPFAFIRRNTAFISTANQIDAGILLLYPPHPAWMGRIFY